MIIEIDAGKFKVRHEIHNKFSILTGNSGIGKTTIWDFIYGSLIIQNDIIVKSPKSIIALDRNVTVETLALYSDNIIALDEDAQILHLPNTASLLTQSNNYFMIVTRKMLKSLPVALNDYRTVEYDNGVYQTVPIFKQENKRYFSSVKRVLTEDSDAGLIFLQRYGIYCESSNGNASLAHKVKKDDLVVFDASAIAMFYSTLSNKINKKGAQQLDWNSFENYVLSQQPFNNFFRSYLITFFYVFNFF